MAISSELHLLAEAAHARPDDNLTPAVLADMLDEKGHGEVAAALRHYALEGGGLKWGRSPYEDQMIGSFFRKERNAGRVVDGSLGPHYDKYRKSHDPHVLKSLTRPEIRIGTYVARPKIGWDRLLKTGLTADATNKPALKRLIAAHLKHFGSDPLHAKLADKLLSGTGTTTLHFSPDFSPLSQIEEFGVHQGAPKDRIGLDHKKYSLVHSDSDRAVPNYAHSHGSTTVVTQLARPVATYQTLADALSHSTSQNSKARVGAINALIKSAEEIGHALPVIHHHPNHGFHATVAASIAGSPYQNESIAKYLGAWAGLITQHPEMVAFEPDENGPDAIHIIKGQSPRQLADMLTKAGQMRFSITSNAPYHALLFDEGAKLGGFPNGSIRRGRGHSVGDRNGQGADSRAKYREAIRSIQPAATANTEGNTPAPVAKMSRNPRISANDLQSIVMALHHNKEDFAEGDVLDRLHDADNYELRRIPIDQIDPDEFETDPERVSRYVQRLKDSPNYPPPVLGPFVWGGHAVIDGAHRVKALQKAGHTYVNAYVPVAPVTKLSRPSLDDIHPSKKSVRRRVAEKILGVLSDEPMNSQRIADHLGIKRQSNGLHRHRELQGVNDVLRHMNRYGLAKMHESGAGWQAGPSDVAKMQRELADANPEHVHQFVDMVTSPDANTRHIAADYVLDHLLGETETGWKLHHLVRNLGDRKPTPISTALIPVIGGDHSRYPMKGALHTSLFGNTVHHRLILPAAGNRFIGLQWPATRSEAGERFSAYDHAQYHPEPPTKLAKFVVAWKDKNHVVHKRYVEAATSEDAKKRYADAQLAVEVKAPKKATPVKMGRPMASDITDASTRMHRELLSAKPEHVRHFIDMVTSPDANTRHISADYVLEHLLGETETGWKLHHLVRNLGDRQPVVAGTHRAYDLTNLAHPLKLHTTLNWRMHLDLDPQAEHRLMLPHPDNPGHVAVLHWPATRSETGERFSAIEHAQYHPEQVKLSRVPSTDPSLLSVAESYAGRPLSADASTPTMEESKLWAKKYEDAKHDPKHPDVAATYAAMAEEVRKQWHHLQSHGYKMEPSSRPMYKNSADMTADVVHNKHLWYDPTTLTGYGSGTEKDTPDHPLLALSPEGIPYNDMFRAVHDVFGHALHGHTFGRVGEERAYQDHKKMFSPAAHAALTSETKGQNSWVNAGPHSHLPVTERPYAEQKATIL